MARYAAKGTLLKIGDGGGSEVFTTIAQVMTISGPSLSMDTLDTTDHDAASFKTFVGSYRDGGEVTLEIHWDPATATHGVTTGLLKKFKDSSSPTNYQLVFPDTGATTWSFAALVTAFAPSAPHDGKLTASVTLKVSGAPTLA
jgi:predicted secreted protein